MGVRIAARASHPTEDRSATETHGGVQVLTLTRMTGETIRIGDDIEVHVLEVRGNTVRLGFKAPREVTIHREEVYEQIASARRLAVRVAADAMGALTAALGGTRGSGPGTPEVPTNGDTTAPVLA